MLDGLAGKPARKLPHPGLHRKKQAVCRVSQLPQLHALPGRHDGELHINDGDENLMRHHRHPRLGQFAAQDAQRAGQLQIQPPLAIGKRIVLQQQPVGWIGPHTVRQPRYACRRQGAKRRNDAYARNGRRAERVPGKQGDLGVWGQLRCEGGAIVPDTIAFGRQRRRNDMQSHNAPASASTTASTKGVQTDSPPDPAVSHASAVSTKGIA